MGCDIVSNKKKIVLYYILYKCIGKGIKVLWWSKYKCIVFIDLNIFDLWLCY